MATHASAQNEVPSADANDAPASERVQAVGVKPAPLPAMQDQLPSCIDILYDISHLFVNNKMQYLGINLDISGQCGFLQC